jgi:hypothetical protein
VVPEARFNGGSGQGHPIGVELYVGEERHLRKASSRPVLKMIVSGK